LNIHQSLVVELCDANTTRNFWSAAAFTYGGDRLWKCLPSFAAS
jgi:hypothetical protein